MAHFDSDGVEIAYLDAGRGDPVVLVHGFGSNKETNWVNPGWVDAIVKSGRRVVALDNRGHGQSAGPHDPAVYHSERFMAEDVRRLMDHLDIEVADVMGYSMGAWISAYLTINHPARVRSVVFGGLGLAMVDGIGGQEVIARGLEAETDAEVTHLVAKAYRAFAIQTKSDRLALAACMRGARQPVARERIATITCPVLVAVGTRDAVSGSAAGLAALMPNATVLDIPDRDHMLAVGDKIYKAGAFAFWDRRP